MVSSAARTSIAAAWCVALSGCHTVTGLDDLFVREGSTASSAVSGAGGEGGAGGTGGLGAAGGGGHGGGSGGTAGSPCTGDAPLSYSETVLCDHPLAYWRFDETDPTDAIDEVGNAHPGTYRNGALAGAEGIAGSKAAEFHASGDAYVEIGDFFDFEGQAEFSIEAWVMPSSDMPEQSGIVSKFDGSTKQGYNLALNPGWMSASRGQDDMDIAYVTMGLPPVETFTHVVLTYDMTTLRLYKDGVFNGVPSMQSLGPTADALTIGSHGTWGYFDGRIDEVAIYDHRLLDSHIEAHHAAGIAR